ncbi:hypothetical protein [Streptomyces sp. NPDC001652]|uniref:hypothetical protein n=1 Tax=Streptomyces sp. NPDC001652 TaxID=3154393 RepID=UPI003320FF1B
MTALLYYFGYWHAYWFFDYFGVNSTMLGFGTVDYLIRSLDALFVPMVVVAAGGFVVLWGHQLLRTRLASGMSPHVLHILLPVFAGVGFLLALGGFWSILDDRVFLRHHLAAAPLSLACGVTLLDYALHLHRVLPPAEETVTARDDGDPNDDTPASSGDDVDLPSSSHASAVALRPEWAAVAEWGMVFALVGLSLVWAANDYAAAVGRGRAEQQASQLATAPAAVLYSKDRLGITGAGVREIRCGDARSGYLFRYEGLTLVIHSAGQYVMLPKGWTSSTGVAFVIPQTDSMRIEFVPYSARGALGVASC